MNSDEIHAKLQEGYEDIVMQLQAPENAMEQYNRIYNQYDERGRLALFLSEMKL